MTQSEPQITVTSWIKLEDGSLIPFDKDKLAPPLDPNDTEGWARVHEGMRRDGLAR
jgi:hypothetical protein